MAENKKHTHKLTNIQLFHVDEGVIIYHNYLNITATLSVASYYLFIKSIKRDNAQPWRFFFAYKKVEGMLNA